MSDKTDTIIDTTTESTTRVPTSRRGVLKGSLTALGAVTFGVGASGTAAASGRFNDAPGQGGQAVMPAGDFKDEPFTITERSGSCAPDESNCDDPIDGALFQCNQGGGEQIFLVGWRFEYEDPEDDEVRTMYTRSNNIQTGTTYTWGSQKVCEDSGTELVPTPEDLEIDEPFIPKPGVEYPIDFAQTSYSIGGAQGSP